jgi:hypothetical protein
MDDPHRTLGTPRKHTDLCSKCGKEIPEEHVPLILWADGGGVMWVYCEACEEPMFNILRPVKQ